MIKNRLGYIVRCGDRETGYRFKFREGSYTRKITSRGDMVYSKMLLYPMDYDDVMNNTEIMRTKSIILVTEPFFLDDELREKVVRWVEWANSADPREYNPFYDDGVQL